MRTMISNVEGCQREGGGRWGGVVMEETGASLKKDQLPPLVSPDFKLLCSSEYSPLLMMLFGELWSWFRTIFQLILTFSSFSLK